ncbi:uncharacterized protein EDB93DRAFT_1102390 [Suillus bovinus]|uniref:uncharacterized protein n=1 Tax=Suillus bovinus TaxID=48563 RepID=UPI001B86C7DC|nr:uncharacterized protein EDB93DRAFT_1102390 [Suillus bovinus]KAG2154254.1 hypothetical protein EDB93DRAFT_1102390 [Suillus bovinus]
MYELTIHNNGDNVTMPNTIGKNDRVPSLLDDLIKLTIEYFVAKGYSNTEIVSRLRKHYDADDLPLEKAALLVGTEVRLWASPCHHKSCNRASASTLPKAGKYHCVKQRKLILRYMNAHHQEDVQARKSLRLKRSVYWTASVNDVW